MDASEVISMTKQEFDKKIHTAYLQGQGFGKSQAYDKNKSKREFIRGIPIGMFIGLVVLLAFQKFVLGIF